MLFRSTFLTERGKRLSKAVSGAVAGEAAIRESEIFSGGHSHAILIRDFAHAIRTGLEQRDFAILYGASAALTLIYGKGRFSFPGEEKDALVHDERTRDALMAMDPRSNDVVIITSANDPFVAEVSAKNSALQTIAAS